MSCTRVCTYVCVHGVCVCVCTCVRVYVCTCVRVYVCVCTCVFVLQRAVHATEHKNTLGNHVLSNSTNVEGFFINVGQYDHTVMTWPWGGDMGGGKHQLPYRGVSQPLRHGGGGVEEYSSLNSTRQSDKEPHCP